MRLLSMLFLPVLIGAIFIVYAGPSPVTPPEQAIFLEFSVSKLASAEIDDRFNLGNNFTIEAWVSLVKGSGQFGTILGKPISNGAQPMLPLDNQSPDNS